MLGNPTLSAAAIAGLACACAAAFARPRLLGAALALALALLAALVGARLTGGWDAEFAFALWITVAVCLGLFALLASFNRDVARLAPLLLPYLLLLSVLAAAWSGNQRPAPAGMPTPWLVLHIGLSVVAYVLVTLGAIAGFGVMLREGALKAKRPGRLVIDLPAIADGEALQYRFLAAGEALIAASLATGLAGEWISARTLLRLDHKTVLSVVAFLVVGLLLLLHARSGMRGRQGARWGLAAYLLLTLAYPGVKFVTDVLLHQAG